MKFKLIKTGYCDAFEHHAIKGGRRKKIQFPATVGLLEHPEKGYVLFDTGYSERFFEETRGFPNKIYALITKVYLAEGEDLNSQLKNLGIDPNSIKHVVISHFHGDHVCGLKDFPNAQFYCSRKAVEELNSVSDLFAVSKGILKGLFPSDFASRVQYIEDLKPLDEPLFDAAYDLFGDGSIELIDLHGHGCGQYGIRFKAAGQKYFLAADGYWLRKSLHENILPHPIVKLFFSSWKDYKRNLEKLHRYYKANPDVIMLSTHCNESVNEQLRKQEE